MIASTFLKTESLGLTKEEIFWTFVEEYFLQADLSTWEYFLQTIK